MFFREYCEFIEALYIIYYSKMDDYEKKISVEGKGSSDPVASNATASGRQQNRRVEVYLYASKAMVDAANNGTLK